MENDRTTIAKTLIKAIQKSKKLLQIYPSNNMIYRTAIDEVYAIATDYLYAFGDIAIKIKPDGLFIDSEEVYQSNEKGDNIALFFFKEGVREIIFREGLDKNELEEFLKLLGMHSSRDDISDDFLIVLWEKDLVNIKLVVDDLFLIESQEELGGLEGNSAGEGAEGNVGVAAEGEEDQNAEKGEYDDRLMNAYHDGLLKEDMSPSLEGNLSAEQRAFILAELQRDPAVQIRKISEILIYILLNEPVVDNCEKITGHFESVICYSIKGGFIAPMLAIVKRLKGLEKQTGIDPFVVVHIRKILLFCVSSKALEHIGAALDNTRNITEEELIEYAWYFGRDAVSPLITLLESLQTIHARRMVNDVLIHIGKENIDAIIERLSDPVWYIVRNVICVLRGIGDARAQDSILGILRHGHPRVRLEALKSIQDFKNIRVFKAIEYCFDDMDSLVRLTAVSVMGSFAKENPEAADYARNALLGKIMEKEFEDRDFREKKAFHEVLAGIANETVETYMLATLKRKWLFGGRKQSEARACAAHYLGLAGSMNALPVLEALMKSSDPLLIEHASAAVQRIRK